MYSGELIVGARSQEAVEHALRAALPSLGLAVRSAIDVANVSDLWEKRRHEASVAIGPVADRIYGVSVRGPRSPSWSNELARRLSLHLGGWAASCVSDGMLDEHGYGYYLDGLVVEAAARNGAAVLERAAFLRDTPDRVIFDSLNGESLARNFQWSLDSLAGSGVVPWPPSDAMRLFLVEGDGITVSELARPPSTLVVAAGHRERIEIPGFEYDVRGDGADVRVLVARTSLPLWEIQERIEQVDCVAFFTDGAETYARKADEATSDYASLNGLRFALDAWQPVHDRTYTAPMAFTFDAVRAISPWR